MDKEYLNKMKNCSHLLPDPGGEVVRGLIEQVENLKSLESENERLEAENARLEREKAEMVELVRKSIRYLDMVASPDGSGHGDLAMIIETKLAELGGE